MGLHADRRPRRTYPRVHRPLRAGRRQPDACMSAPRSTACQHCSRSWSAWSRCWCRSTRSATCTAIGGSPSYFAWVSLFTSAMLLVVLASDLFELYVGWEVMGICSYLLVGHYRESRGAGLAAIKAFLVTRLGDVAFLFGIFTLGFAAHSFAIADVTRVSGSAARHRRRGHLAAARRCCGQERAVPAADLAARRHGRPDPGVGPDPRRDHGRGRGLRGGPALPRLRRVAGDHDGAGPRRCGHHAAVGTGGAWCRTTSSECSPGRRCRSWPT